HFLALRTSQQHTHVVARSPLIQKLAEHLHTRAGRLLRLPKTNNLNLVVHLDDTALHTPRHHRATTRNREHVLNRHQERLVNLALRHRNVPVHLLNQLQNRRNSNLRLIPLQRLQRTALHNRRRVTREVVLRQKLPNLHLHQLEKLRIVHHVRLVQKHHDVRHAHLTRQQNMLARLRHRTIRRRYHQNRTVHLRRTRDHVLHIVRMPRTVHVRVVTVLTLVLYVRRRNRDPSRLLLRRLVNLIVRTKLTAKLIRQHLRQRRRQRRLTMVNVTNRAYVHMRLRAFKLLLGNSGVLTFFKQRTADDAVRIFMQLVISSTSDARRHALGHDASRGDPRSAAYPFLVIVAATFAGTSMYFANSIV